MKICKILVAKKRFFLQKGGQRSSKVNICSSKVTTFFLINADFCRTKHDVAQRSPPCSSKVNIRSSKVTTTPSSSSSSSSSIVVVVVVVVVGVGG